MGARHRHARAVSNQGRRQGSIGPRIDGAAVHLYAVVAVVVVVVVVIVVVLHVIFVECGSGQRAEGGRFGSQKVVEDQAPQRIDDGRGPA